MSSQEFGDGKLDCSVSNPQKESEGTQNPFISYLVTTRVGSPPTKQSPR
jgi:hypothetical protein